MIIFNKALQWSFCFMLISLQSFSQQAVRKNIVASPSGKRTFIHPGILQNGKDLAQLKKQVLEGAQPWKDAFERLKKEASADVKSGAVSHVARGASGQLSKGGFELMKSSRQAYAAAMVWYITGEKSYAEKAIQLINEWSAEVWDFEGNDAKLIAGWTGHDFVNAAEILRYSASGWKQKDIDRFQQMLLTVYYPLLKNYFPEANGNWDAAIINSLMCIGIFCDRYEIFDSAVNHYLFSAGNGSITKYIYPTGQCEESTRDQNHTQLGLGEFAQACQVAWTQGVDLYATAGNRLALGIEFTAKYMAGEEVPVYGNISPDYRGRYNLVYDAVLQHYSSVKHLEMPYTKRAVDSTRSKAGIELLSSFRAIDIKNTNPSSLLKIPTVILHGAINESTVAAPVGAVVIQPGQSIQAALDKAENTNGTIILAKGIHTITEPLQLRSGLTLAGEGKETILLLDPKTPADIGYVAIRNVDDNLHDVVLRDFVVEGALNVVPNKDPNHGDRLRSSQLAAARGGIILLSRAGNQLKNIQLKNMTVRHCTHHGVAIKGVSGFKITDCDFSNNGGSVSPGWGMLHNLLLEYAANGEIRNSRFDDSPWGSGIELKMVSDVVITGNELARNYLSGVNILDSKQITIEENLVESNDAAGISQYKLFKGNDKVVIRKNVLQYNGKAERE